MSIYSPAGKGTLQYVNISVQKLINHNDLCYVSNKYYITSGKHVGLFVCLFTSLILLDIFAVYNCKYCFMFYGTCTSCK